MVNANGIKNLGGNGAALNRIANPLFLKVIPSEGAVACSS